MSWVDNAACRGMDTAMFFTDKGDWELRKEALAVCAGCPVARPCLVDALATPVAEDFGVRGGTSVRQRLVMRGHKVKNKTRPARKCPLCGVKVSVPTDGRPTPRRHESIHDTHRLTEWWERLDRYRETVIVDSKDIHRSFHLPIHRPDTPSLTNDKREVA